MIPNMNPLRIFLMCFMCIKAQMFNEASMDNSGKEFILVFLNGHRNTFPVQLTMTTTSNSTANILVQTPIWNSSLALNLSLQAEPREILNVDLSTEIWLKQDTIEDKAVLVTSSEDIVLYASQAQFALSDSAIIYPVKSIGRSYVSLSGNTRGLLGCVATGDNTSVTVTSPNDIELFYNGKRLHKIQVSLNKYQTFLINADDNTGSTIKSNQPIACFSGSSFASQRCSNDSSSDFLNTQLLPVEYWPSKYFIVSNPNYEEGAGDFLRVVSFYNYTDIGIERNGTDICEKYEVKLGTYKELFIPSGETAVIRSNKPIQIGQISCSLGRKKNRGDARLFIPISDDQFLSSYTFPTPLTNRSIKFQYELLVVSETNLTSSLVLDGVDMPSNVQWKHVKNIGFSFCVIDLEIGVHRLQSLNPGKFGGYMLGFVRKSEIGTVIGRKFTTSEIKQTMEVIIPVETSDTETNIRDEVFVIYKDGQLPELSRLNHFHRVSSMGCLMWCIFYQQCIVVSYNKTTELCVLYIQDTVCLKEVDFGGTIYMKNVVYNALYNT